MENKLITVTKTATEQVDANAVRISVTANGEGKRYANALENADAVVCEFSAAMSKVSGIKVTSGGTTVSRMRDGNRTSGYRAAQKLYCEFSYDADLLKNVLDALGECPAEWNVSFIYNDDGLRDKLLTAAVQSASADARLIAAAAGVKIGGLCKVDYSSDAGRPMLMRAAYGANLPEPEQITLSETVTCSFEIL